MSSATEGLGESNPRVLANPGHERVRHGELLRHPVYTRILHWSVAIFFILSLLSGFGLYTPWLFHWLTPLFGGGPMTRFLHPWFGLLFVLAFAFQFFNWLALMAWTESDNKWMRRIKGYVSNQEKLEPEDVGFFNAGQKLYFWAIVISALLFLISGLVIWFDDSVPRISVWISYIVHDIAALIMLGGFIIHVYEGTAAQPGTFKSMTDGTVTEKWAWTHHPAWFRAITGRDPRQAYERSLRRVRERETSEIEQARKQDSDDQVRRNPPK